MTPRLMVSSVTPSERGFGGKVADGAVASEATVSSVAVLLAPSSPLVQAPTSRSPATAMVRSLRMEWSPRKRVHDRVHNVVLLAPCQTLRHGTAPSAPRRPPRRSARDLGPGPSVVLVAARGRGAAGGLCAADAGVGFRPGRGRPPRAGPVRRPADDLAPAGRVAGQGLDRPRRERLVPTGRPGRWVWTTPTTGPRSGSARTSPSGRPAASGPRTSSAMPSPSTAMPCRPASTPPRMASTNSCSTAPGSATSS